MRIKGFSDLVQRMTLMASILILKSVSYFYGRFHFPLKIWKDFAQMKIKFEHWLETFRRGNALKIHREKNSPRNTRNAFKGRRRKRVTLFIGKLMAVIKRLSTLKQLAINFLKSTNVTSAFCVEAFCTEGGKTMNIYVCLCSRDFFLCVFILRLAILFLKLLICYTRFCRS